MADRTQETPMPNYRENGSQRNEEHFILSTNPEISEGVELWPVEQLAEAGQTLLDDLDNLFNSKKPYELEIHYPTSSHDIADQVRTLDYVLHTILGGMDGRIETLVHFVDRQIIGELSRIDRGKFTSQRSREIFNKIGQIQNQLNMAINKLNKLHFEAVQSAERIRDKYFAELQAEFPVQVGDFEPKAYRPATSNIILYNLHRIFSGARDTMTEVGKKAYQHKGTLAIGMASASAPMVSSLDIQSHLEPNVYITEGENSEQEFRAQFAQAISETLADARAIISSMDELPSLHDILVEADQTFQDIFEVAPTKGTASQPPEIGVPGWSVRVTDEMGQRVKAFNPDNGEMVTGVETGLSLQPVTSRDDLTVSGIINRFISRLREVARSNNELEPTLTVDNDNLLQIDTPAGVMYLATNDENPNWVFMIPAHDFEIELEGNDATTGSYVDPWLARIEEEDGGRAPLNSDAEGLQGGLTEQEIELVTSMGILLVGPDGREYPQPANVTVGSLGLLDLNLLDMELITQSMDQLRAKGIPAEVAEGMLVISYDIDDPSANQAFEDIIRANLTRNRSTLEIRLAENVVAADGTTYESGSLIIATRELIFEGQPAVLSAFVPIGEMRNRAANYGEIEMSVLSNPERTNITFENNSRTLVLLVDGHPRMLFNTDAVFIPELWGPQAFTIISEADAAQLTPGLTFIREAAEPSAEPTASPTPTSTPVGVEEADGRELKWETDPRGFNRLVIGPLGGSPLENVPDEAGGAALFESAPGVPANYDLSGFSVEVLRDLETMINNGDVHLHPQLGLIDRQGRIISATAIPKGGHYDERYSTVEEGRELEASSLEIEADFVAETPDGPVRIIFAGNQPYIIDEAGIQRIQERIQSNPDAWRQHANKTIIFEAVSAVQNITASGNSNVPIHFTQDDQRFGFVFENTPENIIKVTTVAYGENNITTNGALVNMYVNLFYILENNNNPQGIGSDYNKLRSELPSTSEPILSWIDTLTTWAPGDAESIQSEGSIFQFEND